MVELFTFLVAIVAVVSGGDVSVVILLRFVPKCEDGGCSTRMWLSAFRPATWKSQTFSVCP